MTHYPFNRCDEMEQLEAIWEHGVKVAEPEDEINRYNLHQIDFFYVEEEWHKEHNLRRAFYSFACTNAEKLKPYLDKSDVKKLS